MDNGNRIPTIPAFREDPDWRPPHPEINQKKVLKLHMTSRLANLSRELRLVDTTSLDISLLCGTSILPKELMEHIANYLDIETAIELTLVCKSFYKFLFDGWLISRIFWGNLSSQSSLPSVIESNLVKLQPYNVQNVQWRDPTRYIRRFTGDDRYILHTRKGTSKSALVPKCFSIWILTEGSIENASSNDVEILTIQQRLSLQNASTGNPISTFVSNFLDSSFKKLNCLTLDSVILELPMMSAFKEMNLRLFNLNRCCTTAHFRKLLDLTDHKLEHLCYTISDAPPTLTLPKALKGLVIHCSEKSDWYSIKPSELFMINGSKCEALKSM